MRERAALLDGALEIRSRPGRGTDVRLTVAVASRRAAVATSAAASRA